MAKKIKYTQKELKGPDKFTTAVISGFEYFQDHTTKILIIVVSVIVVLVGAYAINVYTAKKHEEASVMFDQAVQKYDSGSYAEALDEFKTVQREFPDKNISGIALYYTGLINYKQGNYEESIRTLDDFINSGIDENMLIQSAILTQGLASFEEAKWQQAIDYLTKLESEPLGAYSDRAKLYMALSYEKLGQPEKAETLYRELDRPETGFSSGMSPVSVNPSAQSEVN
ncbi:MAG: tetratricopeptide repeat protein [Deltaproteobacteria bacterium]